MNANDEAHNGNESDDGVRKPTAREQLGNLELENIRRGEENQLRIETQRKYLELDKMYDFHLYRLVSSSSPPPSVPIIYVQALVVGKTERRNEWGFLVGQRTFKRHAGTCPHSISSHDVLDR